MKLDPIKILAVGEVRQGYKDFISNNGYFSYREWEEHSGRYDTDKKPISNVWVELSHDRSLQFIELMLDTDKVIFCDPVKWNDLDLMECTLGHLDWISNFRPVIHYNLITKQYSEYRPPAQHKLKDLLHKGNTRKTDKGQVWVAGCSYAHGWFLQKQDDRYGQVFADRINMPVSFITAPGASNPYIIEQILQADIQEDDVVVIGLTGSARQSLYLFDQINHVNIHNFSTELKDSKWGHLFKKNQVSDLTPELLAVATPKLKRYLKEELLISYHTTYETISHIEQVINYLTKIKVKFLIGYNVAIDEALKLKQGQLLSYLAWKKHPNVFLFDANHVDFAKDSIHPGPKQHKLYADQLTELYNKLFK